MDREQLRRIVLVGIAFVSVLVGAFAAIQAAFYVAGFAPPHGSFFYPPQSLPLILKSSADRIALWRTLLWSFSAAASISAGCLYFLMLFLFGPSAKRSGDYGSAHWATAREIKASGLLTSRGVVVGALRHRNKIKLLRYDGEGHTLVVSPSRSGKGVTVVVPTGLTWEHSALFNDIKGELWTLTAGWRKERLGSICLRFDATCDDGSAARWNPLFEIREYPNDVRDAQNIALTLASSDSGPVRSENERHWRVMGVRLVRGAILHQLYVGNEKTLPGCYRLLTSTQRDLEDTFLLMLHAQHDPTLRYGWKDPETEKPTPTHPVVAHIARDMLSKSDKERAAIVSSAISYLEPFDDPIMAANVSESDFSLSDLMNHEKPVSLYLTTPVADLERVQTLHRLFFTLAGTRNTEHLDYRDGRPTPRCKHPLLEVFDECFHLGYTSVIPKHFSLAAGYGIYGLFVFQDLSQLFELYGRNESITSNCDVKVAFAPNNLETAAHLSKLLGVETREKEVHPEIGRKSAGSRQTLGRPLLTPDECARLPREKSIILRNGFPPILGDKLPYYKMPELRERSRIPPPQSDKLPPSGPRWFESAAKACEESPETPRVEIARTTPMKKRKPEPKAQAEQMRMFPSLINDKK